VKRKYEVPVIAPEFEEILDGMNPFSHIVVQFRPCKLEDDSRKLTKVRPMGRKDLPQQDIFVTRSPAQAVAGLQRPVPERSGIILRVQGLEILDKSTIIDLKPVHATTYALKTPRSLTGSKQISRENLKRKKK